MRYRAALTIPAGTTEDDPAWSVLDLEYGYAIGVEILFPAGHAGLTYVQVYYQSRQIFPLSPGEAFRGDDHQITFNERFPILEVPYQVVVYGWAPNATLDHTVFVDITMDAPPQVFVGGYEFVPLPEGM